ncbi:hypothetical protein Bealeia1_01167 [Candidatus Bealeia paramacronuclearis]|uniref:Uncharacterized protein n=1 Tax=Candidatus Bealeia paramacronuclearis TaxID=1921001 RepID=A0ABZ2C3E9_9PROT|nr:hypothetical protein [Candidatus Bealeia paramacronuclearis]
METELTLEILGSHKGFPPFSARGCVQTLEPIPQGELHRTVNGDLVLVGGYRETKYRSKITCKDKQGIALGGVIIGAPVRVGCIQRLVESVEAKKDKYLLKYNPVEGSIYFISESGMRIQLEGGREIALSLDHGVGYLSYRPTIEMRITSYKLETDEWGMTVGWALDCEEI